MKQTILLILSIALTHIAAQAGEYELVPLLIGQAGVGEVAFSDDGRWLAVGMYRGDGEGGGAVKVWDVAKRQVSSVISVQGDPSWLAFAPGAKILGIANTDGTVGLWDVVNGRELVAKRSTQGRRAQPCSMAFTPQGGMLAWGTTDGNLQVWPLTDERYDDPLKELKLDGFANSVSFSPDGETMVLGLAIDRRRRDGSRGEVQFWDVPTMTRRRSLTGYQWLTAVTVSHNGSRLSIGCREFVDVIDVASERRIRVQVHQPPFPGVEGYCLALSPDGQVLATARSERSPIVALWDADSGQPIATLPHPDKAGITSIAFSPDNVHFVAAIGGHGGVPGTGGVYLWKKAAKDRSTPGYPRSKGALPKN